MSLPNEFSLPWGGTSGPGDTGYYSDEMWRAIQAWLEGFNGYQPNGGILAGSGPIGPALPLLVVATGTPSNKVVVQKGAFLIQGFVYALTADTQLTIPSNTSGNPRIDTVIVRVDYIAQTVRLALKIGTPAASPARPALTQSAGTFWEAPLADVSVASGFTTIPNTAINNHAGIGNGHDALYHNNVLNNSGGELETGDVVAWDTTQTSPAVKGTTTADDPLVAGVWVGLNVNGTYGRVQYAGLGFVKVNAAVAVGKLLVASTTAKYALAQASGQRNVVGRTLAALAAAGRVLAQINVQPVPQPLNSGCSLSSANVSVSNSGDQAAVWTSAVYQTDAFWTSGTDVVIPIKGRYIVNVVASYADSGATSRIKVNGTIVASNNGGSLVTVTYIGLFNVGDVITATHRNSTSGGSTVTDKIQVELLAAT